MAILQPIIDLAAICYGHGIRHVVISPGSRSAALTLAFARHGGFKTHVCIDERSAGFIAMGMAQQIRVPVVLICTSGSAAYNFAPAVSEAFFQQIPLLILTADRPKEWLHQYDGQTIYQNDIYGKHVKKAFELSPDYGHKDVQWSISRTVNEAINVAAALPYGPVHINIPIREPFYPQASETWKQSANLRIIKRQEPDRILSPDQWMDILNEWDDSKKILIAIGQHGPDERLSRVLAQISDEWGIPIVGDCISNLNGNQFIGNHDLFLSFPEVTELQPDLLITAGLSFISKDLKNFLRKNTPKQHWHIGLDNILADPTQSVSRFLPISPTYFFESLFEKIDYQLFTQNVDPENDEAFGLTWSAKNTVSGRLKHEYLENLTSLNDLTGIDLSIKSLKSSYQLHVANSMSIRYLNMLGMPEHVSGIFSNRGTSGIDGCVSTAIGAAMVNGQPTVLIVGDVAFLYDRNGFLNKSLPENLKIIVLNNAGGNIFRMIDGPTGLPEMEEFFETRHSFSARRTCEDSAISYFKASDLEELESVLLQFWTGQSISLLEIFTDPYENEKVWRELRRQAREQSF
ncbi:2-succinyl-5-enolpyruvyl-6-hydroxy-3-cyclohexene-1-carboxylic-acid synthase [Dyadobacter luticola]|uniref:2-succinyl-5-enolpyruvyl-6-hydroxy-3-cyclohexene-1-carboxylate synthase n=1 Tax=Dyadobacter luticola TaxID=1979387 RepID=A0A5R9L333_9BACT|nr:2-succinyl-5-enolpyruvyl-6-hydroxy-3-cyclohexene-1-carboxylic-acid synthase [Dyadobacter luticola]TLV02976.1 2-succinyl-5-enolpyruvyl-6-hydroxy-3-cyclohexene-1-carboxylic-acid synthase [Dyadobacter luticola]